MDCLTEYNLLKRGFIRWVIPSILVATLGSIFPYIQALIPVHEAKECLCGKIDKYHEHANFYFIFKAVDNGNA